MAQNKEDGEGRDPTETDQLLSVLLQAAFSGAPTPLKDIPKRNGTKRALSSASNGQRPRKRRQRKNRAA